MAAAAFPLTRKFFTDAGAANLRNQHWHVYPACAALWQTNRTSGRNDTFIGIMDTDTWRIYVVPCFGVTADEAVMKLTRMTDAAKAEQTAKQERRKYPRAERRTTPMTDSMFMHDVGFLNKIKARLNDHDLPNDLTLVSGSTSTEKDAARTFTWVQVKSVYGDHGVCLVLFEQVASGFDGKSHQALKRWVERYVSPAPAGDFYNRALGFAIQRDELGYYVRFSSTLNLKQGMAGSAIFAARVDRNRQAGRETRDLPKQWAQRLVVALAGDLHAGYFPQEEPNALDPKDRTQSGKFFGRMVSRGEDETTKYKRIYEANRSDAAHRLLSRLT